MLPGWPHEAHGNVRPRWMAVLDRIRLIGLLQRGPSRAAAGASALCRVCGPSGRRESMAERTTE